MEKNGESAFKMCYAVDDKEETQRKANHELSQLDLIVCEFGMWHGSNRTAFESCVLCNDSVNCSHYRDDVQNCGESGSSDQV